MGVEIVEGEGAVFWGKCGASHCNQWGLCGMLFSAMRSGDVALPQITLGFLV